MFEADCQLFFLFCLFVCLLIVMFQDVCGQKCIVELRTHCNVELTHITNKNTNVGVTVMKANSGTRIDNRLG